MEQHESNPIVQQAGKYLGCIFWPLPIQPFKLTHFNEELSMEALHTPLGVPIFQVTIPYYGITSGKACMKLHAYTYNRTPAILTTVKDAMTMVHTMYTDLYEREARETSSSTLMYTTPCNKDHEFHIEDHTHTIGEHLLQFGQSVCTICCAALEPPQLVVTFPVCSHTIHLSCCKRLFEYPKEEYKTTCQLCKQNIAPICRSCQNTGREHHAIACTPVVPPDLRATVDRNTTNGSFQLTKYYMEDIRVTNMCWYNGTLVVKISFEHVPNRIVVAHSE
jgi:hypothetical protein